jgi:2-phosphoglycerate kinase
LSKVEPNELPWRVLLLGGPSGVGKTSVSYALARRFGVGICEIDDLHIVAKQITTPAQQPVLHQWDTDPRAQGLSAERILELHIAVCRVMSPSIEAVMFNHVETNTPIVLEGDYVLPEVLSRVGSRVAEVFLHEPDEAQIVRNFAQREPGGGEQAKRARVSWLFGRWLKEECSRHGAIALPPRPWNTLLDRIVEAIG